MYDLDTNNPDTLINAPAPHCPEWFVKALTQLGGTQLDGKPNLKVVWGQTERKFACGQYRVKYPTPFVAEKEDFQFRLRNIETNELTFCSFGEFMEAKRVYDKADPDIKWLPEYKVSRRVEWIGVPRWIIEQYMPVVLLKDTPSNWEANRYGWWFNPEKRQREWTDINGPFPYEGRYEHFLTVKEEDGTHDGRYKPIAEDTLQLVRSAIQKREQHHEQSKDASVRAFVAQKEDEFHRAESQIQTEIEDSLAPHINRMYENKVKFYSSGSQLAKPKRKRKGKK